MLLLERELVDSLKNEDFSVLTQEEKETLSQAKIIHNGKVDESTHMRYLMERNKFKEEVLALFINFSSRCNFNCSYCYQDARTMGSDMTKENWERLLSFISNQRNPTNVRKVEVVLFGGEPLMNYNVLHQAVQNLKAMEGSNFSVNVDLITNGSLLTKDRATELAPYLDSVQITIDGTEKVHNERRPYKSGEGSFQDVLQNLRNTLNFTDIEVTLRINVEEETIPDAEELLSRLKKLNLPPKLNKIGLSPTYASQNDISGETCAVGFEGQIMKKIAATYEKAVKMGYKVGKEFINGPCLSYYKNSFAVDENLQVYKCPGYLYEEPDGFITPSGELEITSTRWYEMINDEPSCLENCKYAPICYGGCRWQAGGPSNINCNKKSLDQNIEQLIRAHAISVYGTVAT